MPAQRRLVARRCSRSQLFPAALAGHYDTPAARKSAADRAERHGQDVTPLAEIVRRHSATGQARQKQDQAGPQQETARDSRELNHDARASKHVQTTLRAEDSGRPTSARQ